MSEASRRRALALLSSVAMLGLSGCLVLLPPGSPGGGGASARIVPSSVHLERGHVFAQAFVEARDRAEITMSVEGPGAVAKPVLRRCRFVSARGAGRSLFDCTPLERVQLQGWRPGWLESQSVAMDASNVVPGPYTLRIHADGAVLAEQRFTLVEAPTVGAKTVPVVAPHDRPNTLVFDGERAYAWMRIDSRASWGKHYMRFAWFRDGALLYFDDTEYQPRYLQKEPTQGTIELDAPAVDVQPFALDLPKDPIGAWSVVALLDGALPQGTWELTVTRTRLEGAHAENFEVREKSLPVGWVTGVSGAADKLVELAKKEHHVGPPSQPLNEPIACARAFEPAARPLVEKQAKLSGLSWGLRGVSSAAYQDEYATLARAAAAQGRIAEDGKHVYVTQDELDRAGQRGNQRSAPVDAEQKRAEAEMKVVAQQVADLGKKYKVGCLSEGFTSRSPLLSE
jgi:hypothetical protein